MYGKWQKQIKAHFHYYIYLEKSLEEFTQSVKRNCHMVYTGLLIFTLYTFSFFNKKAVLILIQKTKGKNWVSVVHRNDLIHKNIML